LIEPQFPFFTKNWPNLSFLINVCVLAKILFFSFYYAFSSSFFHYWNAWQDAAGICRRNPAAIFLFLIEFLFFQNFDFWAQILITISGKCQLAKFFAFCPKTLKSALYQISPNQVFSTLTQRKTKRLYDQSKDIKKRKYQLYNGWVIHILDGPKVWFKKSIKN